MAKFRAKPKSVEKAKRDLDALMQRKKKSVALALGMWMDDTVGEMQQELHAVGAHDQGLLEAATTRDPVTEKGTKLNSKGHNELEHASVIEWGRKPGTHPPLLPLVGWAVRKGIVKNLPVNISFGGEWEKKWAASGAIWRAVRNRKGGKKSSKPLDPQIRDLLTIRAIANKIFEKGTKARHPFSRVLDRRIATAKKDLGDLIRLLK